MPLIHHRVQNVGRGRAAQLEADEGGRMDTTAARTT